jgi:site-specific recombinase
VDAAARQEIDERIEAFAAAPGLGDRTEALVRLVRSARMSMAAPGHGLPLLESLDADPARRDRFYASLAALLAETDATALFAETGLPSQRGFWSELTRRVSMRLVPAPRDDRDLSRIVRRLYRSEEDVAALRDRDPRFLHAAVGFFSGAGPEAWAPVRRAFGDGFRVLALRVMAHGLVRPVRARSAPGRVTEAPFFRIFGAAGAVVAAFEAGSDAKSALAEFRRISGECRKEIRAVRSALETAGVSVQIVFDLEIVERALTRMALMADVVEAAPGVDTSLAIQRLLLRLATLAQQDRSIRHLVRWNLHLLDRKIVERSGETGEHYVARDRKEYRHIWAAAAGGGALTVLTAAVKMAVHGLHLAPFPESFLYGLNYALSFLLLQAFGLILATKQPAMTAATVAKIIRTSEGEDRMENVANFFSRVTSSQLAAATANVLAVGAGATAFDALWRLASGGPYLEAREATTTFETLSPLDSGTVFYAAVTGVLLWMASVAGGWFENWVRVNRLPEAIAAGRPERLLTAARRARLADRLERSAAGWGTNLSLGFLLGFAPAVGRFFGIPFDVRHVTLSTGQLALSASCLGERWFLGGFFLRALGGIAVMFVLNLSVSFGLSLRNAARAYEMSDRELFGVLRRVFAHFVRHPLSFVLPPRAAPERAPAPEPTTRPEKE